MGARDKGQIIGSNWVQSRQDTLMMMTTVMIMVIIAMMSKKAVMMMMMMILMAPKEFMILVDPGRSNWLELDLLPIAGYCRLMRTEFDPVYFSQFVNRICFNLS